MKSIHFKFIFIVLFSMHAQAAQQPNASAPLALIYKGPGSCEAVTDQGPDGNYTGCSEAVADVALSAGFRFKYVGPESLPPEPSVAQIAAVFENAKIWIQPGGKSVTAYQAMTVGLQSAIKDFVAEGGGYVGFCAGAFMATSQIGTSGKPGLGIFPGSTAAFQYVRPNPEVNSAFLDSYWNNSPRSIYFEGGPYLYGHSGAEVVARFDTGATLAARTTFGEGRVFITGGHPEAPLDWSSADARDPDGLDLDLAIDMLHWAAHSK